ncbi:MAG: beta-propeller fold lactonase family protein [Lactobacillaceae bacterium]|jgi:YVTN family beta-propeller protein|nr:beta-propeller fold lactonase family protein [Lactobacillaceae bacterium]
MTKVAYVTNTDSNDISVVDLLTEKELGRIGIGDSPRGAMAIDKKRNLGYVSNTAGETISVIDLVHNTETRRIAVGLAPRGVDISPDFNYLFVSNSGSGSLSIVDLENQQVVKTILVGRNPRQLSISLDGRLVCVPNFGSDSISLIEINYENITDSQVLNEIELSKDAKPYHAYIDKFENIIFTANTFNSSVSVIDLKTQRVVDNIIVGAGPRAVISDLTGKFLFVSSEAANAVSVIDRETRKEFKRIPVGGTPRGMQIDPDTNHLLISDFTRTFSTPLSPYFDDKLTVIDINKLERIGNLPTGLGACSVNIFETEYTMTQFSTNLNINEQRKIGA